MKKIKSICLVLICTLSMVGITASAKEETDTYVTETSIYSVEYGWEVEEDKKDECEVYIAVPWDFSKVIPKHAPGQNMNGQEQTQVQKHGPVQTGDASGITVYFALAALSVLGICGTVFCRRKGN